MTGTYRLFGSELSPYSVKVRAYLRYKGLPHDWIIRSAEREAEFSQYATLPLVPLVVTPEGEGLQDSTPIMDVLEARHPEPPLQPQDAVLAFLSTLIEDYADEWGNKWMFHYRWTYEEDQRSAAQRICQHAMPGLEDAQRAEMEEMIRARMTQRRFFVGSSETTRELIEGSFRRMLSILERHLETRPYLFGARPALGDFGLYGQLSQLRSDPTPGAFISANCPKVNGYIERMHAPVATGPFEAMEALLPGLTPLVAEEIAGCFLPWADANARALAAGEEHFAVTLDDGLFEQQPQKYHAKSLKVLRQKYQAVADAPGLAPVLDECGVTRWLAA